jgi:hypothetical protein
VLRVKACPTLSVLATMASVHHFLLWHRWGASIFPPPLWSIPLGENLDPALSWDRTTAASLIPQPSWRRCSWRFDPRVVRGSASFTWTMSGRSHMC